MTKGEHAAFTFHPEWLDLDKPLTKREFFAAMALQGIIGTVSADDYAHGIAQDAVDLADELIEALNRK